ncbi:TRAP transporter large permease [Epibacterium ulvae]|uniref:TRAP transporter large permease n=1 Tax=Epibacterium ulvae TaxID=1156985 RepID=UPI001BFCB2EE|nr:TRAP transporter large permease [Epibacterium ulvae]MBT8155705.1 TRAP transporter large permease [Epibacterium ulvae]
MDPLTLGLLALGAALLGTMIGVPVAISLGLTGLVGLWGVGGFTLVTTTLETLPHDALSDYSFVVIPMFILMGVLASHAKVTNDIYEACYRFMAHVKGSLYMVTVISSAGFATISGSTIVSSAVFTRLALPEMIRFGYNPGLSAGCIAAAGTFATLIPPSIMMVIYALLTGESIGRLLIAGAIPGFLTAAVYLAALWGLVRMRPQLSSPLEKRFTWPERRQSLTKVGPFVILSVVVIGGIYTGLIFPSSAGAVGAIGALALAVWRGVAQPGKIQSCLNDTASTAAALFLVLLGGLLFSRYLVFSGFIFDAVDFITDSGIAPWQVLMLIIIGNLILGMFIDTVSITVVTVPFIHPIIVGLGYDPIWFGILLIKLVEISAITPPVGLNLFAVMAASDGKVETGDLFRGVLPFLLLELLVLLALLTFPDLSLWLPRLVLGS